MQLIKLATQRANTNWYPLIGGVICYSRRIRYPQIKKNLVTRSEGTAENQIGASNAFRDFLAV